MEEENYFFDKGWTMDLDMIIPQQHRRIKPQNRHS